ncbi:GNAT family N-acetyltransferase [Fulvimonas soli]|jgi:GNAT superfamily N-acetyltransferase|uniref:Acetyltransferase (GNAT) family protein n=1 Tax=Fulvimonas soli TaxID=155197 RepID=A0A316IA03_9GAMM|nr:GNAT family N-acetyltransferase [Fulvimonas soli]PWK89656.1 acetyltransferase (GNAT) family protein [Fulvimonas soli]TNY27689.1 GNAT family N-acetyltransferase [Fulvimonas soli]
MIATPTLHPALAEAAAALPGDHWIETLNDGSHVLIRPIRPEDRERERDFIERLSPESQHFRFFGMVREAGPVLLDQMVNVDYVHSMAFVALVHDNGALREVGVSRYAAAADASRCECAVTVADDWRHRGLAVALMRRLIDAARQNGFRQMFSIDAAENEPMRELAAFLGFRRKPDPADAHQVVHTLDL